MIKVNEEAYQKALAIKTERDKFQLCINELICPLCGEKLNYGDYYASKFNHFEIYTCSSCSYGKNEVEAIRKHYHK